MQLSVEDAPFASIDETASLAVTRARTALIMDHPFFASLAMRLALKADSSCRDLWTDGRTLAYNPAYAATQQENRLIGALAHEVMHLACGHHVRRKDRDEDTWNRACDLAINHILLDAGFILPDGFERDPRYADMAVDDIYIALARLRDEDTNNGAKTPLGAEEGGHGEKGGSSASPNVEEGGEDSPMERTGEAEPESFPGEDGPGTAGAARVVDQGEGRPDTAASTELVPFRGEVRDHPDLEGALAEHAQKRAEQEADIALSQAVQRALNMGDLPAGFSRLVERVIRPRMDWRELLRRFLENCADSDYSWMSPNRRYVFQDIYLPSRREPRISHLVLAVDTSGSVDEEALAVFLAEMDSVLDAYDTTLTVLFHDSRIQAVHTLTRRDIPLHLTPQGGGGTDYRPVGDYLEKYHLEPACLIWFTDLQCDRYPEEPEFPILWVSSLAGYEQPPFGEVLCMAEGAQ